MSGTSLRLLALGNDSKCASMSLHRAAEDLPSTYIPLQHELDAKLFYPKVAELFDQLQFLV